MTKITWAHENVDNLFNIYDATTFYQPIVKKCQCWSYISYEMLFNEKSPKTCVCSLIEKFVFLQKRSWVVDLFEENVVLTFLPKTIGISGLGMADNNIRQLRRVFTRKELCHSWSAQQGKCLITLNGQLQIYCHFWWMCFWC